MPKLTFPAAGEAMPGAEVMPITGRFSRRLLLGAFAAAPAMAATAALAATIPAAPAEHPDAELFRLDCEMEEAQARMEQASKVEKKIYRKCAKLYPPKPAEWEEPRMPDDVMEAFAAATIGDTWNNKLPTIWTAWNKEVTAQRSAWKALKEAHAEKVDAINREGGLYAVDDASDARFAEVGQVGKRIFATPAHTLDGMVIKLRASDRLSLEDFPDNEAFVSIAADIRRLAQGAKS
ncbi:hypothetical protein [Mesorhizobium sp. dw_380]|uniref:hypothetical protein n=1 Tax=Mesorhizobium sp. dw_380 TaxID=2812001 RepID=UPI001BDF6529|nr:hypothetical protein [Mesorhizobium sp. dw_380]